MCGGGGGGGGTVNATSISTGYCGSPMVQEGLKIKCTESGDDRWCGSVVNQQEPSSNFAKEVNNYGNTMDFREILREAQNEEKSEQREKEQRAKNLIIHGML